MVLGFMGIRGVRAASSTSKSMSKWIWMKLIEVILGVVGGRLTQQGNDSGGPLLPIFHVSL